MAKIVIISQKWNESVLALAKGLQQSRKDVMVITSFNENISDAVDFPVLTYFKKWSSLESLQLFPRLLGSAPEIWHFVFTDTKLEKPSMGHLTLAALIKALPNRKIAVSFYGSVIERANWRWRPFLQLCDMVTSGTRESLMFLKRHGYVRHQPTQDVLPPLSLPQNSQQNQNRPLEEIEKLSLGIQPYFLVPSDDLNEENDFSYLPENYSFLFLGPRPHKSNFSSRFLRRCYFISQTLHWSELELLAKRSLGILIAFEEMSLLELLRCQELSYCSGRPLLVNQDQMEALPGLCHPKKTGFVLDEGHPSLGKLIDQNNWLNLPTATTGQGSSEAQPLQLFDQTLNRLNRLYSEALSIKGKF